MIDNTLQNVRIVLARAEKQVASLKADLRRRGAEVIELPALEIEELDGWETAVFSHPPPTWTIVCNRGAAERLARVIRMGQGEHEQLAKIVAIGASTSKYLEKNGLWAQRTYSTHELDLLAHEIGAFGSESHANQRIQLIAPETSAIADQLEIRFASAGVDAQRVSVYRVHLYDGSGDVFTRSHDECPDLVVFPSLKTISHYSALLQECGAESWADLPAAAIGATTSKAASEHGYTVVAVPTMNTMQALVEAIAQWHSVH